MMTRYTRSSQFRRTNTKTSAAPSHRGLIRASAQRRIRDVTDILRAPRFPPNRNWMPRLSRVRDLVFMIVTSPSASMLQLERDVGRSPLWNFPWISMFSSQERERQQSCEHQSLGRFSSLLSRFLPEQQPIQSRARSTAQPQQARVSSTAQGKQVEALCMAR